MSDHHSENSPLLGGFPSPSHTITPPLSPSPAAPLHTPTTLQVPHPPGAKAPHAQASMDSGCESDGGEGDVSPHAEPHAPRQEGLMHTVVDTQIALLTGAVATAPVATAALLATGAVATAPVATAASLATVATDPTHTPERHLYQHHPTLYPHHHHPPTQLRGVEGDGYTITRGATPPTIVDQLFPLSPSQPGGGGESELSSPGPSGLAPLESIIVNVNNISSNNNSCSKNNTRDASSTNYSKSVVRDTTTTTATADTTTTTTTTGADEGDAWGRCSVRHEGGRTVTDATAGHDLSSKVTFRIEGEEGEEGEEDEPLSNRYFLSPPRLGDIQPAPLSCSLNKSSFLSSSSSTASMPFCRICHLPEGEGVETLISPCRCAGTMEYIHHGCLMKWLEVSSSRSRQAPSCELCNYQFHRRKKFRLRQCQLPSCSRLDKVLHSAFLVCLLVMVGCAAVTVVCFKQNSNPRVNKDDSELTDSEVVTLSCGVLFFVAFFVAMYVEVKATDTLYRLCSSFIYINQTMHIYEYDRKRDAQYCTASDRNAPV